MIPNAGCSRFSIARIREPHREAQVAGRRARDRPNGPDVARVPRRELEHLGVPAAHGEIVAGARERRAHERRARGGDRARLVRGMVDRLTQVKRRNRGRECVERRTAERPLRRGDHERAQSSARAQPRARAAAVIASATRSPIESNAPPPPPVIPFPRPKLSTASGPNAPRRVPRSEPHAPCAASSITAAPCSAASAVTAGTSAG